MSDHGELADQREKEADRLEREHQRVGEEADEARGAFDRAKSDALVPEALGEDDPAHPAVPEGEQDADSPADAADAGAGGGDEAEAG